MEAAAPADAKELGGKVVRTWEYETPTGATTASAPAADVFKVILFYKYVVIDAEQVAEWQRGVCAELGLSGRVLVGNEGVNGTLAGSAENIDKYIELMSAREAFTGIDWKDSTATEQPFPDMHVKVVKEIISTGGVIPNDFTVAGKHLSPADFHEKLVSRVPEESVVLDVRNYKEYSVGHFDGAIRSEMRVFAEFPRFIDQNIETFKGKQVMMYCTGGIRCEKASAYLKANGVEEVYQLQGGIHRYLEQFPTGGEFKGKNFVFDKRVTVGPPAAEKAAADGTEFKVDVVGRCEYCEVPYDELDGSRVCTVCRDLVLACDSCQERLREYHCEHHMHLKDLYFSFLEPFTVEELREQQAGLKALLPELLGRRNKNKRATLNKQIQKLQDTLAARSAETEAGAGAGDGVGAGADGDAVTAGGVCRTCEKAECNGRCWGFWKEGDAPAQPVAAAE